MPCTCPQRCSRPMLGAVLLAATSAGSSSTSAYYPDLQTVVPHQIQLVNTQQREILRFTNGFTNLGGGPLAIRPDFQPTRTFATQEIRDPAGNVVEEHPAGSYEYHPTHHHWHVADVALFQVHSGSETGAARRLGLHEGRLLPDRLVQARRQREDARADVLVVQGGLPGRLGRLGRPVPPAARRPERRADGRPERRLLAHEHRQPVQRVPRDALRQQHRLGQVRALRPRQREPEDPPARPLAVRRARDVRRERSEPLGR